MEPRLRNSSGPVEAMPKHKQAGHTTVLTKYAQTPQKTLAMQEPPTQDIDCALLSAAQHHKSAAQILPYTTGLLEESFAEVTNSGLFFWPMAPTLNRVYSL